MKTTQESGFTLVEVVTVLAIIGVLSGIIAMNMTGDVKKTRLKEATTQLYSDLKKARIDAMSFVHYPDSRGYGLKFSNATTYQTFEFDDILESPVNAVDAYHYGNISTTDTTAETRDAKIVTLPNNVQVRRPSGALTEPFFFDRRGWQRDKNWSTLGGTFILDLTGTKSRCIVLSKSQIRQGYWDSTIIAPEDRCRESN